MGASASNDSRQSGGEATRQALLRAALILFGERGYDGTSTRQIAAMAGANIASIAYHFGGKAGLREACARFVVETLHSVAGASVGVEGSLRLGPEEAEERLILTMQTVTGFLTSGSVAPELVQFVLRELTHPGPAVDIMYRGAFEPVHRALCRLWEQATGEPAESEATRITIFTMIGQIVYLRIGREAVRRRMGWDEIGPREAALLAAVAAGNIRTIIAARREPKP